jgi:dipeptidyl aminopeptidase/acylaminoacyl peptidase
MDRSSAGGSPQRLLPEDSGQQIDPSWSPDGRKMIFSTGEHRSPESHISILDLATHRITSLPDSDGKASAHWSPDGQFISASSLDTCATQKLRVASKLTDTMGKPANQPFNIIYVHCCLRGAARNRWIGDSGRDEFGADRNQRSLPQLPSSQLLATLHYHTEN